ncbi:MAG: xanthine dehydrogenase accessory protein XdhC [bacterium]
MTRFFAHLATYEATGTPFVLATVIETGGSTPRDAGARMAITHRDFAGTIGGGAFEKHVIDEARALLADPGREVHRLDVHLVRDLGMCCGGRMSVLLETIDPAPPLRIYGAGHVGTALAEAARLAGFAVTIIDARAEWSDPARFHPDITVIDAEPEDHLRHHTPGPADYVVVVTHDHPLDEALVRAMLPAPPGYLGLIGSRGKWARFQNRYRARGFDDTQLARVRCPVGLDIGARTPPEIAISIVAELIAARRGGPRWQKPPRPAAGEGTSTEPEQR